MHGLTIIARYFTPQEQHTCPVIHEPGTTKKSPRLCSTRKLFGAHLKLFILTISLSLKKHTASDHIFSCSFIPLLDVPNVRMIYHHRHVAESKFCHSKVGAI